MMSDGDETRRLLAEVAVVAVREAQRTAPRQQWLPGTVVSAVGAEVRVSISGMADVYATPLVTIPEDGEQVVVVFSPNGQAFTIPYALPVGS